jgi:argonaute-like protein implicated in RNA metabolism and viral defense
VTESFEWVGVDVQHSPTYRISDDDGMPDMGSYAQLDDETVLIVTTDAPRLDEGTPQPILCKIAVEEGDFDIYSVGRDAFYLSELNWGAPSEGIKDPLTVYLTREMNRRLSHDRVSRLTYPPF